MTLAQAVLGSDLTGARPTLPARAPRALRAQKRNIIQRAVNGESGAQSGAAGAPTPAAYPGQFPPGPPGADQRGEFPDMRYQMPPPYPYAGETAGEGAPPQGYYYGYYPPMPAQQAPVTVKSDPGVPTIVWMGVGAILGVLGLKFWNFAKDGPAGMQQKLMASAMENMMKTQAKGINVPGMSNFPGMGGTGAPPQAPGGGAGGPIVDTTASPAPSRSDSPKVSEWDKKKRSNGSADRAASPATASSSSASDDSASKKSKSKSAFRAASPSPAADAASKSTVDAEVASESSGRSNSKNTVVTEMVERMLSDPESQKMMYPYLPEHMRNPETFKWMMENPEMKAQITTMLENQFSEMDPNLQDAVSGFDIGSPEVQAQFDQLGMKPDEFMNKVWSDPELVAGMSNPKVQAALMDMQKNPMNAMKHMQDPEVSKVLMRMQQIMQPQMAQNMPGQN